MRRIPFLLLLILIAVPLFATQPQPTLVDDVIRMSKAGVPEESIITFIHKADGRFDVSANDMIAMTEAGVPKAVISQTSEDVRKNWSMGMDLGMVMREEMAWTMKETVMPMGMR